MDGVHPAGSFANIEALSGRRHAATLHSASNVPISTL